MKADVKTVLDDVLRGLAIKRAEITRLREEEQQMVQLAMALTAMLPRNEQKKLSDRISKEMDLENGPTVSLVTATKLALNAAEGEWLTAAQLRDAVIKRGFNFRDYKSNPLASVATTVRRLQKQHPWIEASKINGVTAYRIKAVKEK